MAPKKDSKSIPGKLRSCLAYRRIYENSDEAEHWKQNAQNSPLLRLPAEIRLMVYELVLGGNTIKIHYTMSKGTEREVPRENYAEFTHKITGGFGCTVGPRTANPYHDTWASQSQRGFTLLNSVCRQLYKETATLPYKLNTFAFATEWILSSYVVMAKRLPLSQRRAIRKLHMHRKMPSKTLQNFLGGLECVKLEVAGRTEVFRASKTVKNGWRKVEEVVI